MLLMRFKEKCIVYVLLMRFKEKCIVYVLLMAAVI